MERKRTREPEWEEVGAMYHPWNNPGEYVEGELLLKDEVDFEGRVVGRYTVDTPGDGLVEFLGSSQLDRMMETVKVGDYIRVTYVKNVDTRKGRLMKVFKVERAK
jgi:hypothetical protein